MILENIELGKGKHLYSAFSRHFILPVSLTPWHDISASEGEVREYLRKAMLEDLGASLGNISSV